MALPIERWSKQAIALERKGGFEPVASKVVLQDVDELKRLTRQTWARRQMELEGHVTAMAEGTYGALLAYPNAATVTTTSINGTVNLYPELQYTALPVNGFLAPSALRLVVCAKITTAATPGNIGFDPRIGSTVAWTTGGTAIGATGATMGASTNVALTASITNSFYYIVGDMMVRSIGNAGANTVAVGMFQYVSTQATSSGLAGPAVVGAGHNLLFGGTSASFDNSVASGIALGGVHTVTTITHNVEQVYSLDWN